MYVHLWAGALRGAREYSRRYIVSILHLLRTLFAM